MLDKQARNGIRLLWPLSYTFCRISQHIDRTFVGLVMQPTATSKQWFEQQNLERHVSSCTLLTVLENSGWRDGQPTAVNGSGGMN